VLSGNFFSGNRLSEIFWLKILEREGAEDDQKKATCYSSTFKANVVLAAVKGEHTLAELAEGLDIHSNQLGW